MSTEKTPAPVILGRYAGIFSRAAAFVLDRLIAFGIAFLILLVIDYFLRLFQFDQWFESQSQGAMINAALAILLSTLGIYLLVSVVYDIGFWLLSGQTPGKRVLGLRVMRRDGTRLRLGNALLREVGYWISAIFSWVFCGSCSTTSARGFTTSWRAPLSPIRGLKAGSGALLSLSTCSVLPASGRISAALPDTREQPRPTPTTFYRITVAGELDASWSDWLGG